MSIPIALTIAGSDSSGGAGIQADLKTFAAHNIYGASAITALTAQNTTGVEAIYPVSPEFVNAQIDAVFSDLDVKTVKIGMLADAGIVEAVAASLEVHRPEHIVLDPVMVATSGDALSDREAGEAIASRLIPLASLITPNIFEAAALLNRPKDEIVLDMDGCARDLLKLGARAVLVTGGDLNGAMATDVLHDGVKLHTIEARRIKTGNTHGTGCTLSSAIAANLALGFDLEKSVRAAKDYVTAALATADELDVGHGAGPLNHFHGLWEG
jgi:hydroxymethylpyrimidine/phosphomethylpyrimidine kinase